MWKCICECVRSNINFYPRNQDVDFDKLERLFCSTFIYDNKISLDYVQLWGRSELRYLNMFVFFLFLLHQFIFLSLWFHNDYFEHNWLLSAITLYVHIPQTGKRDLIFNLIFQVTCVGQLSQSCDVFSRVYLEKIVIDFLHQIFFLTSPHV